MLTYKNFCWFRSYLVKDQYLRSKVRPKMLDIALTCRIEKYKLRIKYWDNWANVTQFHIKGTILPLSPSPPEQQNFRGSHYPLLPVGGAVGIGKAGAVQVCRQTSWHLQWRKQTQALHCHCSHRVPVTHLPGKKNRHSLCCTNTLGAA